MTVRMLYSAIALVIGCCLVTALSPSHTALAASEAVTTPIARGAFDDCVNCWNCESGYHYAEDGDPEFERWTRNGGAHLDGECYSGSCDTKHGPVCYNELDLDPVTDHTLEALRSAVAAQDLAAIASLMRAHRAQISLNAGRSAIQVTNCRNAVVVHLPVSGRLVAAIAGRSATGD